MKTKQRFLKRILLGSLGALALTALSLAYTRLPEAEAGPRVVRLICRSGKGMGTNFGRHTWRGKTDYWLLETTFKMDKKKAKSKSYSPKEGHCAVLKGRFKAKDKNRIYLSSQGKGVDLRWDRLFNITGFKIGGAPQRIMHVEFGGKTKKRAKKYWNAVKGGGKRFMLVTHYRNNIHLPANVKTGFSVASVKMLQ